MIWQLSHRADKEVLPLVDQHYSRGKPGTPQFAPPGTCIVFKAKAGGVVRAVWGSSYPKAEYVKHRWAGAWQCFIFRNESPDLWLSSELVAQAVAATRAVALELPLWGAPPPMGMVTFVDEDKTRRKRDPGRCYLKAGWNHVGYTEGGLVALQQLPLEMPPPEHPLGWQRGLFAAEGGVLCA
jgi:hypothetical protein